MGNIYATKCQNAFTYVKVTANQRWDVFLRQSVINIKMAHADGHHCMTVTLDRVKVISACTIHIGLPAYPTM